ncbi:hypothetical protein GCM10018782_59980 [Streptomyces griseoaurantiacus]|nr:hypothetical protein GCM10018782_59980 [Streptomyces griseoaurantiacus]
MHNIMTATRHTGRGRAEGGAREARASRLDHSGVAGSGTHLCGVVVGCQGSALALSSALQPHAPDPARVRAKTYRTCQPA